MIIVEFLFELRILKSECLLIRKSNWIIVLYNYVLCNIFKCKNEWIKIIKNELEL